MKETKVKGMVKNQKAITLIALVITIIVLLILAGVSIMTLTGEHGILGNADKAKFESQIGKIQERIDLWKTEHQMAKYTGTKAKDLPTFLSSLVSEGILTQAQANEVLASERNELVIRDRTLSFYIDGQVDMLPKPVISKLEYTKNGNKFNINVSAHEEQPLEDIYIGELTKAEGAEYEFVRGTNGLIVSQDRNETGNLQNIRTAKVTSRSHHVPLAIADSYIKVDLTNVIDNVVVNIEASVSSAEWGGMVEISDSPEFIGLNINNVIEGVTTKKITLELEAGKENYIHFLYGYGYVDEENGITDSFTINKLEINRKITNSELTYKYIVNGVEQENNEITMDATKLQEKEAVEGTSPKIPVGFRHLEGSIDSGYVITDIDQNYTVEVEVTNSIGRTKKATEEIKGNEFVWIPVNASNPFERRAGYKYESQQDISYYGEADALGKNEFFEESVETQTEAIALYQSVADNDGFYIGRYEAGVEFGELIYDEENWNNKWVNGTVVCKKDVDVYNYEGWNDSGEMSDEIGGAIGLARSFASVHGYDTTKVHTTLCYGVQWDTALNFMDPGYVGYAKDSTGKGNESGDKVYKTGSNDNYAVKNIYDMAGNVDEWTMESSEDSGRITRGGNYWNGTLEDYPASSRYGWGIGSNSDNIGFRIAIYL